MGAMWGDPDWEEKTKHLDYTFKCFRFWGNKIGCISGQIKEKYGEPRWYAGIGYISSLHDIFKAGHHYYRWGPAQGGKYIVLDFLNNWSKFLFGLWPIRKLTLYWQLFFYNVAYWLPMLKYPGQAYEILVSGDHSELIWGGKKWARKKGIELGTLEWLLEREAKELANE